MKRILSLLLVSVLLLTSLASCVSKTPGGTLTTESLGTQTPTGEATQPSTNEPTGEATKEPDATKPEVAPTVLPETTSEADLTCFGTSYKLFTLTDLRIAAVAVDIARVHAKAGKILKRHIQRAANLRTKGRIVRAALRTHARHANPALQGFDHVRFQRRKRCIQLRVCLEFHR